MSKSQTLQSLKAELENVNAAIEKYQKVRTSLIDVITFLGNEELEGLMSKAGAVEKEEPEAEETHGDGTSALPAVPQDGIEAVRKALAARNRA